MTISFVGGITQDLAGGLSLTFDLSTVPGGPLQAGDYMIAFVKQSENVAEGEWDDDGGGGNGWVREVYNRTTSGRDQESAIYTKVHTGTENNPTFTWWTGSPSEPMSGSLLVYRGNNIVLMDLQQLLGTNNAAPPNAAVTLGANPVSILTFHGATHDDISAPAAPTGYTMRTQVWAGTANDHRNHFTADLLNTSPGLGGYTPPDWQHTVLNTTPEYHCYTLALFEEAIGITDQGDEQLDVGDTGELIDGFGFEATQGTGTVEIGDNVDYGSATLVTQTINSWSDTQIDFDVVLTGLAEGFVYVFVTNDNGDRTVGYRVTYGAAPYVNELQGLDFDIIHSFDNTYADDGTSPGNYPANGNLVQAPESFKVISGNGPGGSAFAWGPDSVTGRIEMVDTPWTNVTNQHTMREIIGWIYLPADPYKEATVLWEEGGGVNNIYYALGPGNALFFNIADSNAGFSAQAYGDFPLTPERWYLIHGRFEGSNGIAGVQLWIDGVLQGAVAGDLPITSPDHSTHSGDYCYGDADGNLDTGGTDIAYSGANGTLYSWWATCSELGGGAPLTDAERRRLFETGAPPVHIIGVDTEANMQIALDALGAVSYQDVPLALDISTPSDTGGDLRLDLNGKTFDAAVSAHVRWRGGAGDTLTLVNSGASNAEAALVATPYGGSVVIENPATFTIAGIPTGAEVRIYDDEGGPPDFGTELAGIETNPGTTFDYSHSGAVNDILVQVLATGYEEVLRPFQLGPQDQTLTINPTIETNL